MPTNTAVTAAVVSPTDSIVNRGNLSSESGGCILLGLVVGGNALRNLRVLYRLSTKNEQLRRPERDMPKNG